MIFVFIPLLEVDAVTGFVSSFLKSNHLDPAEYLC